VYVCDLLIIRRIKNYWKECNIDLQEWLKVFHLCHMQTETLEVRFMDAWREQKSMWFNRSVYNVLRYTEIDIKVLFMLYGNDKGLHGHSKKICKPIFNTDIRKYVFANRVIDWWNSLDQDTVDAPSLNCFTNRLNKIRCTTLGLAMWVDLKIRPHKVSTV